MNDRLPTQKEFEDWLSDPVTQCVLRRWPAEKIRAIQDAWSRGQFVSAGVDIHANALKNAEMIATCAMWRELFELDYETLKTELSDGDSTWDAGGDENESPAAGQAPVGYAG